MFLFKSSLEGGNIIPQPQKIKIEKETLIISMPIQLKFTAGELTPLAKLISDYFAQIYQQKILINQNQTNSIEIELKLDTELRSNDYYSLQVAKSGIQLQAAHYEGLFYAFQTLKQILPEQLSPEQTFSIPFQQIEDWPQYSWRG